MRSLEKLGRNWRNICDFGPQFLLRHKARFREDSLARVNIPQAGPMWIRAGDSDADAVRQVFGQREYDFSTPPDLGERLHARYREMVSTGRIPIIVDAGANIGAAGIWFSINFPEAKIVCIEPDPGNILPLERNESKRQNIVVVHAAIGSERRSVLLKQGAQSWGTQTERSTQGIPLVKIHDAEGIRGETLSLF